MPTRPDRNGVTREGYGRRRFLRHAGLTVAAGGLAGCAGGDGSGAAATDTAAGNGGPGTSAVATETRTPGTDTATETATEAGATTAATTTEAGTTVGVTGLVAEPAPQPVDRFLDDANFYNGNMVVGISRVAVGAGETQYGFDPAAIKVATGTQVTWEWVSGEERHSVVSARATDGQRTLNSSPPEVGSGTTYRYTFENPGIYRYICGVHRTRGVVVVAPGSDVGDTGAG